MLKMGISSMNRAHRFISISAESHSMYPSAWSMWFPQLSVLERATMVIAFRSLGFLLFFLLFLTFYLRLGLNRLVQVRRRTFDTRAGAWIVSGVKKRKSTRHFHVNSSDEQRLGGTNTTSGNNIPPPLPSSFTTFQ